jgi:hypothetical protein
MLMWGSWSGSHSYRDDDKTSPSSKGAGWPSFFLLLSPFLSLISLLAAAAAAAAAGAHVMVCGAAD